MLYRDDGCCCGAERRVRSDESIGDARQIGARSVAVVAAVVVLLIAMTAGPVGAQDSDQDSDAVTSSTTAPPTSETTNGSDNKDTKDTKDNDTDTDATTSTTSPDGGASTTAPPAPGSEPEPSENTGETTTTETTTPESTDTTDTTDPLVGEAPADDPLDPNITVPPPSEDDVAADFGPMPILWSSVREAETKWADSMTAKVEAIVEVRALRMRAKELDLRQAELEGRTQLTIDELAEATERLQARIVRGFVQTSSGNATGAGVSTNLFNGRDVLTKQRKSRLIGAVVDVDQVSLIELGELRSTLGTSALELLRRSGVVDTSIRRAEAATVELDAAVDQARIELEAFKAGSEIYVDGVVFPIGGPYSVPLINSFGYPRMPGTPDAHAHEGIDIFAPRGTPLVAAERGVIGRVGVGRLGGLKLWLRGESGADWYYAHLDGFAPGLHNGQVVEAGELLGYVGNTGNAVGTPPHLHLEIHPNGGAAINPYPLMKVVSDLDLHSEVEGVAPGFRYQPVVANRPADATTTTTIITTTESTSPATSGSTSSTPEQTATTEVSQASTTPSTPTTAESPSTTAGAAESSSTTEATTASTQAESGSDG